MWRPSIDDLEDGHYTDLDRAEEQLFAADYEEDDSQSMEVGRAVPAWAERLLRPARFKLVKGGRGSGKSHELAEELVEDCIVDPDMPVVCIREVQRSMRFSSKRLIEAKIRQLGVSHLFKSRESHIERVGGQGVILFQGMQDHTADSIKSLEGFRRAWIEEASSLSHVSLEYLIPTMRADDAEIWASWNPQKSTDAIETLAAELKDDPDAVIVHVNYDENPHLPETLYKEAMRMLRIDPEAYAHVYLGRYNTKSKAQVYSGRWRVDEFAPDASWDGPYYGIDWGFSQDPTAGVMVWIKGNVLYISHEGGELSLANDDIASHMIQRLPGIQHNAVRADSARPETIAHVKSNGGGRRAALPRIVPVQKWAGSVEDGIEHIKSYDEIVVHRRCANVIMELNLYSYKVDKRSGDVTSTLVDKHNHWMDALRYALGPMIRKREMKGILVPKRLMMGRR